MIAAIPQVTSSYYMCVTFQAMLALSFYAFLRPGEVTSSDNNLQLEDIVFNVSQGVHINFARFKHHVGDPELLRVPPTGHQWCPVRLLNSFLRLRGSNPGPLFCHSNLKPITYSQYNRIFGLLKSRLGLKGKITPHCARIGAATQAAIMGIPEEMIKRMGRWHSLSFQKYLRVSVLQL